MNHIEYIEYITKEGDRWDLIAYEHYGDPYLYEPIIVMNPEVPIMPVLPSGIKLKIPVLKRKNILEDLPPWKKT